MAAQDLWIVIPYFDVTRDEARNASVREAVASHARHGLPVVVIEAARENHPFVFEAGPHVHQLRFSSTLWLKENLISIGMSRLPESCRYVAWIDADIKLPDDEWPAKARDLLERCDLVQLFESICDVHSEISGLPPSHGPRVPGFFSLACRLGVDEANLRVNAPGGALAARREVIASGLYERGIVGGADALFARAAFRSDTLPASFDETPALEADFRAWASVFNAARKDPACGFLDQTALHLRHGTRKRRGYASRQQILKLHDFRPVEDLLFTAGEVVRLSRASGELQSEIENYFEQRRDAELPTAREERDSWLYGLDLRRERDEIMPLEVRNSFVELIALLAGPSLGSASFLAAVEEIKVIWGGDGDEVPAEEFGQSIRKLYEQWNSTKPKSLIQVGGGPATFVAAAFSRAEDVPLTVIELRYERFLSMRTWMDLLGFSNVHVTWVSSLDELSKFLRGNCEGARILAFDVPPEFAADEVLELCDRFAEDGITRGEMRECSRLGAKNLS